MVFNTAFAFLTGHIDQMEQYSIDMIFVEGTV